MSEPALKIRITHTKKITISIKISKTKRLMVPNLGDEQNHVESFIKIQ